MATPRARAGTGDRLLAMSRRARNGVYQSGLGGSPTVMLTDPALVREAFVTQGGRLSKGPGPASPWVRDLLGRGVLTSEGDLHRRQRRLIAPAFTARRVQGHAHRIAALAERRVGRWSMGATIDVGAEMAGLTLEIATETLFGIEIGDDRAASFRRSLVAALEAHRAVELDDLVTEIIEDRSRTTGGPDVLAALLAATEPGDGPGLSTDEVRDCIVDLLLAGTETTASTLTWALHLIGLHPLVERRLRSVPGAAGEPELLRKTITETLRLYPPAWLLARTVLEPFTLADRDVRPGTALLASPYALHRDPTWFPSPGTFDPDRWGQAPPPAYLPFGVGGRACIGEHLSWVEMVAVLTAVIGHCELATTSDEPVGCDFALTLRPARPVLLEVRPGRS